MNRNLVEIALQELGAEDRALLELSVVREVSDEDIASLLGVEISHVLIRREEALDRVAVLIGDSPESVLATMRDLPAARWRDEGEEPPPTPEPEPVPEPEPTPTQEQPRQSRLMLALLGGLSVTLVVVVVLALTGDDDESVSEPGSPPAASRGGGALAPLAGSKATGKVAISGGQSPRLSIAVKGLPNPPSGGYVVWLYNSVTDARSVAGTARGRFDLRAPLPGGYRRYRFIDVSREPSDGNSAHSGQSVLRVPLADVPGGR